MSEQVTFILQLKDLMSGGLQKTRATVRSIFDAIDKNIAGTQKNMDALGKGAKIKVDTSDIDKASQSVKNLNNNLRNLPGTSGAGGGSFRSLSFGMLFGASALGGLATQAATYAGRQVMDIGRSALEQGMNAERMVVGLSTFVGDAKAKQIYNQLQQQAVYTPFTSSQLLQVERGMLPYKAPTDANKATMALANAVAATGGSDFTLERMGWHMQQIAAQGKLEKIQEREFGFASIPIAKLIGDAYGMNQPQVEQKIKQGAVTFDMVATALEKAEQKGGMFAGAMEKLSQTIYGKWTTIKDFWQIGEQKLTLSQADNIKKLEDMAISYLQKVPEAVSEIAPKLNHVFDTVQEFIPTIKDAITTSWDFIKPVFGLLGSSDFKNLAKNVLDTSISLVQTLQPAIKMTAEALVPLARAINDFVVSPINGIIHPAGIQPGTKQYADVFGYTKIAGSQAYMFSNAAMAYAEAKGMKFKSAAEFVDYAAAQQMAKNLSTLPAGILFPGGLGHFRFDQNPGGGINAGSIGGNNGTPTPPPADTGADRAERITGGGQRVINININRSPFEIHEMKVSNGGGGLMGLDQLKGLFTQWFDELVESANMAG